MIKIPIIVTVQEIIQSVEPAINFFAAENCLAAYSSVGYAVAFGWDGAGCIAAK